MMSLTVKKSPFWGEPKMSCYQRDIELHNKILSSLGQPATSATYAPYKNKKSLFQNDMHLRRGKELQGVCLPALEHIFQKEKTDMNFLKYVEELNVNEKTIT